MSSKASDDVYVTFGVVEELSRPSQALSEIDQQYLTRRARYRGIEKYVFTIEEYEHLRNLAEKLDLRKELVQEFNKCYSFAYWITRKVRVGAINSVTGMCYDIALHNYARVAKAIEKKYSS